jgi:DNA-binding GntR family transcriptional regulator
MEVTYFEGFSCSRYSLAEHYHIIDALESRDVALAQSRIQANWQNSLKRLKNNECGPGGGHLLV